MEQQVELKHYLDMIKRRKKSYILPAIISFILITIVVVLLPSIYKSTATILVETQGIPQEMVKSTVTGFIEERLQGIAQVVLSRKNLMDIIAKHKLYAELMDSYTTEEIIELMRKDIVMEPVTADVVNPQSGRPSAATIAFTLSYAGKNPDKVVMVANDLVSLYLEANYKNREEKAQTTYDFLDKELDGLGKHLTEIEAKISTFKDKNLYSLPELLQLNLQTLDRLQKDIDGSQEQIKMLMDRRIYLAGQIATIEPIKFTVSSDGTRTMTPQEELKSMRSKYLAMRAALSERHPDVIKLKNQIDAMEAELGTQRDVKDKVAELEDKKTQLTLLSQKYSDKHPDVIRLRKDVAGLEQAVKQASAQQKYLKKDLDEKPDNPAYVNLSTQIASTDMEISNVKKVQAEFRRKYDEYQKRIENSPRVEQEYKELQRDYANTQLKYQDTMARLQTAKEAKKLEDRQMAEKLTLIDPPSLPEKPYKPNRLVILLLGFVLSLGVGAGYGTLVENLDSSVRFVPDLAKLAHSPVLAAIPTIVTVADRRRAAMMRLFSALGVLVTVSTTLLSVHIFFRPLDVIWVQIVRKMAVYF